MDKYKASVKRAIEGKRWQAQEALENARFSSDQREAFFNEAYGEILYKYFTEWLVTDPKEIKKREFIYSNALALGSVREQLITYETYGKNIQHIEDNTE